MQEFPSLSASSLKRKKVPRPSLQKDFWHFCRYQQVAWSAKRSNVLAQRQRCKIKDASTTHQHAESCRSASRLKTSQRLTASEDVANHISASPWISSGCVSASSLNSGRVQAVEQRAAAGMLSLMVWRRLTGVHLESKSKSSSFAMPASASLRK